MSLTESDRRRLQDILADNMETGRQPFTNDHPLVIELYEIIDQFRERGRTEVRSKEIAPLVDYDPRAVGMGLRVLYDNDVIDREGSQTPYRWVIGR